MQVTGLPARYIEVPEEDYFAPFDQTVPAGYQDKTAAQVGIYIYLLYTHKHTH